MTLCAHTLTHTHTQIYDGIKPTLQELEKFEATPEEVEIEGIITL